jgi:hypothetical protein
MIYAASMGPFVKKAIDNKAFQTNTNKIIETLPIDPEVSNMDAVVLGPKDMGGMLGKSLAAAIQKKHASVGVIFVYQKDKEAELIQGDVKKVKVAKVTPEIIEEAINKVIEIKNVNKDTREIKSGDEVNGGLMPTNPNALVVMDKTVEEPTKEGLPALVLDQGAADSMGAALEAAATASLDPALEKSLEQRVLALGEYGDWNFFKMALEKDTVLRELAIENSQYAGVVTMLDVLDKKITNTFKDPNLGTEQRFEEIKQLGVDRAAYKGIQDNIIADKILSIMAAIVRSAESTVDSRVNNVRLALDTLTTTKMVYQDAGQLRGLIDERLKIQTTLMELTKELIEIYKVMDASVADLVKGIDEELPSKNAYINEMLKPVKHLFTPGNAAALATKLMSDLQNNRITMSALENKIQELIKLVFKLCEADNTIIDYQQRLIDLLQSQRVEDVVIIDSVIKSSLRLFVGPQEVGRTATALTWAGTLSRRQNTILIDLSGSSKFEQYGVEVMKLDDFLNDRIERQLVCVVGDVEHDLERVDEIVAELKTRLNYYPFINIILDSKQEALIEKLASSALSVHFVTNCTHRATKELKPAIAALKEPNIARKIILIDPPVEPTSILGDLNIDPLMVKLIIIPRLQSIAAASFRGISPYESREVMDVFEEAFR